MIDQLMRRAEDLLKPFTKRELLNVADRWNGALGDGAARIEGDTVVVRGRGLLKRWLDDASLRVGGGAKR